MSVNPLPPPPSSAGGPLLAMIFLWTIPWLWRGGCPRIIDSFIVFTPVSTPRCYPVAVCAAELTTALPFNGGVVVFAHRAFGPWGAFMSGYWNLIASIFSNASYIVLGSSTYCSTQHLQPTLFCTTAHFTVLLPGISYIQSLVPSLSVGAQVQPHAALANGLHFDQ